MKNKYPIYILSKGRWNTRFTVKALEERNIDYLIIIEESEYPQYASVINKEKILILPKKYQDNYDTCGIVEGVQTKGSGPARNFAWDHSIERGFERHWIFDDNIRGFLRLNNNFKVKVTANIFRIMEDFVDRYENIGLAGPQYDYFMARKEKHLPFSINVRIFSCILIKNNLPLRWKGLYNEDVILSIETLRKGYCTILFNTFLQEKVPTGIMKGGNATDLYKNGTLEKSKMLTKLYPEIAKVVWRYKRWHHVINYNTFRMNKLIKKPNILIEDTVNNYGMELKTVLSL